VLWLSGKNMGEAARLWLVFMPWPVWLAAGFFAPRSDAAGGSGTHSARIAAVLFVVQMAVSIGTVTRVTGFDFPNVPEAQSVSVRERVPDGRIASVAPDSNRTIPR
jgi:hypothetical protein